MNRNGKPVCYAKGCRKTDVTDCFRGKFCREDRALLGAIRDRLNAAKARGDLVAENAARDEEIAFRKDMDARHMWYKLRVEEMVEGMLQEE